MSGHTLQVGGNPPAIWLTDTFGQELVRVEGDFRNGYLLQQAARKVAEVTQKDLQEVSSRLIEAAHQAAAVYPWETRTGVIYFYEPERSEDTGPAIKTPPKEFWDKEEWSALQRRANEFFPRPQDGKPYGCIKVLANEDGSKVIGAFVTSGSWRNPANAADKRQAAYVNLSKRMGGRELYQLDVAFDDWDMKKRKAIGTRIRRAGARAVYFDNLLARGYIRYLVDAPLKGAKPVTDFEATLVDCLRAIRPPERGEGAERFKPIEGSPEWVDGVFENNDPDREHWHVIAVAKSGDAKALYDLEVIALAEGVKYEWVKRYWRRQWGPGILFHGVHASEVLEILMAHGYTPTRFGLRFLKAEVAA